MKIYSKIRNFFLTILDVIISMLIYFLTISIAAPFMVIAKLFELISGDIDDSEKAKIVR